MSTDTPPHLPDTMPTAHINALGGADLITYGELPTPTPGPNDALVEVEALTVNPVDTLIRSGRYPTPTPFPFILGRDLAGTVRLTGSPTVPFRPGDRVWCNSLGHDGRQGSFARFALVPADRLYHLPAQADPATAVAVAHPAATAYLGWFVHARLRPGQTVYIAGAAGNVGRAATQIAAAAGARVIAAARPADHTDCLTNGAEATVDHRDTDLARRLTELAPQGIDIFWNTSGHHDLDLAVQVTAPGGKILLTAAADNTPRLPARPFYTRDQSLLGFVISRARADDLADAAKLINRMLRTGTLTPRIAGHLPLSATADAHRRIESGTVRGRLILHP
ncbi:MULTISPECIES: NADPH:quinone reductase [Streptosporangium]|uniref:NADPH:quinone reductase-like Zn-dependent oxidoreductase n=1 Tax=Streptosporangium brasiliense TaxID=47480 RepID=A0ABT9RGM3_9ACTN|nr:NADPH:quinone reductase [Streptosporangium brasiliense]MDP9868395.1 NADPH:quinone reductase-like Zn-dependent oxidoreductase [Streptosporangium brasiliense]